MNAILNNNGESVTAIGASGSLTRVKVEYPKLIERLRCLFNQGGKYTEAIEMIKAAGITSELAINNLICASHLLYDESIKHDKLVKAAQKTVRDLSYAIFES